ncbi:hypothetical protein ACFL12_03495 [Pseudomonadota bacterium]
MLLKFARPFVVTLAVAFSLPAAAQDKTGFASVIDDLPLMAGLVEAGEGVEFSSAQGRIAEVYAQGHLSQAAVEGFYAKTLPHLGWTRVSGKDVMYKREGETLTLLFTNKDGALGVRFYLVPGAGK